MAAKAKFKRVGSATSSRNIEKRWTPRLVKAGFTPVSDFFLENYHRLAPPLSSLEAVFIIHLMRHKWDEKPPHPSFGTIGKRMGISDTAVRNHARSLQKKRLLNRIEKTGEPNRFDLTPLFDALERLQMADEAAEFSAEKHSAGERDVAHGNPPSTSLQSDPIAQEQATTPVGNSSTIPSSEN